MNWQTDVEPRPALLVLPPAAASLDEAHAAIELWEHYTGKTLDPTQRLTVEVMMAETDDQRWAAATTGREMPRQNGKGDEIEVVELWGLVQRSEAILHTIHDAVLLATQTQERLLGIIEGHADLRRRMKRRWKGTGQQMIEMRNGGTIWYRTRTGGGGRGVDDIDRLVIDEAQHATDEQLAAMTPTLLANANPQMNVVGTAALPERSSWWWKIRRRALMPDPGAFGYVGHTAERVHLDASGVVVQELPDITDRDVWRSCNPALLAGRGRGLAFLEEQLMNLGPEMFAQEHLCVWAPPPEAVGAGPIPLDRWEALTDGQSMADDGVRLGLDAPPDRRSATFGIAGRRADGLLHVATRRFVPPQSVDYPEPVRVRVVELAKALAEGHATPIVMRKDSPAFLAWHADLVAAGVPVDVLSPAEFAEGCGSMLSAVADGAIRHRGQPEMNTAVRGLASRLSGEVEVFTQRNATVDVAPIMAVTSALARVAVGGDVDVDPFILV